MTELLLVALIASLALNVLLFRWLVEMQEAAFEFIREYQKILAMHRRVSGDR